MRLLKDSPPVITRSQPVYCPICTHTVEALVTTNRKGKFVKPGQKCSRCGASLDAAAVLGFVQAA